MTPTSTTTPRAVGKAASRQSGAWKARALATRASRRGPALISGCPPPADRPVIPWTGTARRRALVVRPGDGQGGAAAGYPRTPKGSSMQPAQPPHGVPYDPFNPPPAAIKQAAELLARELMYRGVKPEVHNQPEHRAYLVVVPSRHGTLMVEVREGFYTWDDSAAHHGARSHALWGDHTDAAVRVIATAQGPG